MTNGWVDIKNADIILVMGGNPAENHPCGFKWAMEAKRNRNAKLISVDPRFTRTSAVSDLFCQLRAGSDIAFMGGMISYAIENNRVAKDYLLNYTNAAFIVKEGFKLPEDGLFSGFDEKDPDLRQGNLELRRDWPSGRQGRGPRLHVGRRSAPTERGSPAPSEFAANRRIRPHVAKPELCISVVEKTLFPLHAGNGGAHHRSSQGAIP